MSDQVADPPPPIHASKLPVAFAKLSGLGALLSLLLLALGVVAVRDGLVYAGALDGQPWVEAVSDHLDDQQPADWMLLAAAAALLVGIWLLTVALRPRPRNELQVRATTGVFLSTRSIRRIAIGAADRVDGVDTTSASASRSRITVHVTTWSETPDQVGSAVTEEVTRRLQGLVKPPSVRVQVEPSGTPR